MRITDIFNVPDIPDAVIVSEAVESGRALLYVRKGALFMKTADGETVRIGGGAGLGYVTTGDGPADTAYQEIYGFKSFRSVVSAAGLVAVEPFGTSTSIDTYATLPNRNTGNTSPFVEGGDIIGSNIEAMMDRDAPPDTRGSNSGLVIANRMRIRGQRKNSSGNIIAADVSPTTTNHPFQVGTDDGLNIRMDGNEIQANNYGRVGSPLILQKDTGQHTELHNGFTAPNFEAKHAQVATAESTTSPNWTDLPTDGPIINFLAPASGFVHIALSCGASNALEYGAATMGYELRWNEGRQVGGAGGDEDDIARSYDDIDTANFGQPSDSRACYVTGHDFYQHTSWMAFQVPVRAGKQYRLCAKYKNAEGWSGSHNARFRHRRASVIPAW